MPSRGDSSPSLWKTRPKTRDTQLPSAVALAGMAHGTHRPRAVVLIRNDGEPEDLRRQRLVWLRGSYLPRAIEIAPNVEGVEFAARKLTSD